MAPTAPQTSRPEPPEFEPDPALRLERALCYTGGLPGTLAFVGRDSELLAFPCNNVIVLMDTPVMPTEECFPDGDNGGEGRKGRGRGSSDLPAPHDFLRGHTDTVTQLRLSHAAHVLASAQGDPLGAAGELNRGGGWGARRGWGELYWQTGPETVASALGDGAMNSFFWKLIEKKCMTPWLFI